MISPVMQFVFSSQNWLRIDYVIISVAMVHSALKEPQPKKAHIFAKALVKNPLFLVADQLGVGKNGVRAKGVFSERSILQRVQKLREIPESPGLR